MKYPYGSVSVKGRGRKLEDRAYKRGALSPSKANFRRMRERVGRIRKAVDSVLRGSVPPVYSGKARGGTLVTPSMLKYNRDAVNRSIATNRTGKIGKREAKNIHRLLRGRHGS